MNDRIFELAKHADLIQWDILPSGAKTPDHISVVKARKFAELIVQECILVITEKAEWIHAEGTVEAITNLEKHFGVEE